MSVFFFSQIVVDLIAKRVLPVLLFCIITYFMIGLRLEADKFFIYLLSMFMVSLTAATITYAYSSIARVTAVGTLLSALTFVLSMVSVIQCQINFKSARLFSSLCSCLVDSSLLLVLCRSGCGGSSTSVCSGMDWRPSPLMSSGDSSSMSPTPQQTLGMYEDGLRSYSLYCIVLFFPPSPSLSLSPSLPITLSC